MAEEHVGTTFVKVIPDADRAEWQSTLESETSGVKIELPVKFKVGKGAVTEIVNEAQAAFDVRKALPRLPVKFKVATGAVTEIVALAQKEFDKRKALPKLPVRLVLGKNEATEVVAAAEAKLAAVKATKAPRITVDLDLDTHDLELIREARVKARGIEAIFTGNPIEIPLDLDEKSIARVAEKAAIARATIQARIDTELANEAAVSAARVERIRLETESRTQGRLSALAKEGLDARSLEELRQSNRVALIHERAEHRKRSSSAFTLRQLRNDLGQFDATTTRTLRHLGIGFGIFTAGVVASFAAISIASLKSFADTEVQLRRTAAVLGTDVFSQLTADGANAEQAFKGFREEVERTDDALTGLVNDVALKTVFDPTEIAQGTRALAQAGLNIEQIKGSLLGVAQFAQNEEILPEESVQLFVQGATAAGESLANLTELGDRFTFVANNTTASAKEIGEAFSNRAAPAFRAYGEEVNATLTVLDLFAAAGIKGKTAGEQVGILIREINKASTKTPETTAAFKKYGIEIGKVNGKQIPFIETLGQLGFVLDSVRREQGSQGLARVRKELGLTEKSGAGLLQILPQISQGLDGTANNADEAVAGLRRLEKQISTAGGATARQSSVITDTLSFQTEQFANSLSTLFKEAATPLGKQLTTLFKELNGEMEGSSELADKLRGRFIKAGKAVADVIVPALRNFAVGGEGADFFSGLVETFKGTLNGLRGAFQNFRAEVFGEGSEKGFFSILGAGFAAIGRFSRETLPRIGKGLGILVSLVKENKTIAEGFVKAWLGLFVASKALRLFLIPLASLTDNLGLLKSAYQKIVALSVVQQLLDQTKAMRGLETATKATTVATNALAAAEAREAVAGVASAATIPTRSFRLSKKGAVPPPIDMKKIGAEADVAFAKAEARSLRLSNALTKLGTAAAGLKTGFVLLAKATIIIPVVAGIAKGVIDQLNESMGGDGNVSLRDFIGGLKSLGTAIGDVVGPIVTLLTWTTKLLFTLGKLTGQIITWGIIGLLKGIGSAAKFAWDAIGGLSGAVKGLAGNLPIIGPMLQQLIPLMDGFGKGADGLNQSIKELFGEGDSEWDFSRQSEGIQNIGTSLDFLADGWEKAGAMGISDTFRGLSEDVTHNNARLQENIDANMKLNRERQKAFAAEQARKAAEIAKISVLGVANDKLLPKYLRMTAVQKAQRLSVDQAVASASNFQKRQAFLAAVIDVVTGKTKNQAVMQQVLANSSINAADNLVKLIGGQDRLKGQLALIAQGNKKAANSYIQSATAAAYAAKAVTLARAQAAKEQLAILQSAARGIPSPALTQEITKQIQAGKDAETSLQNFVAEQKQLVDSLMQSSGAIDIETGALGGMGAAATEAAKATTEVKDAATLAAEAVEKMSVAQFKASADSLIARIAKLPTAYKATVRESAILQRAMPALDKALEKQRLQVTKLDEALQALQSTQLEGTKAAADAAFGFDQEVKALQLQQVDLKLAGATDEDPRIKALDEQIAAIQLKSERASLAASLAMDPLKKKLEETFNPVKELSFDKILSQFESLNKQKIVLDAKVGRGEALKAKLDAVVAAAADKFVDVGLSVTKGINTGLEAGKAGVVKASRDTATAITRTIDTTLGIASPSKVMDQRGRWITQGIAQGITADRNLALNAMRDVRTGLLLVLDNGMPLFRDRGGDTLRFFVAGMRDVWTKNVKPFVLEIAEWIKDNKGPIAYDAQLLRPAGEAMMTGFHGGLRDGFREVQGWVRSVAGRIGDNFPKELMFERSARFLLNNAKYDATFNPEDAFGDLLPQVFSGLGIADPSLSFLHKTLSAADTAEMARKLIALFPSMNFNQSSSQFLRPEGTLTASGNISDHTKGWAADLGTGSGSPTADSLKLFSMLKPLLGTVFKQLIHNGLGLSAGGGSFSDSAHGDHIHAAWLPGMGFDKFSGKKGVGMFNIPGVGSDVLNAIAVASQKYAMDPALIAAVMKQESTFRKNVVSGDGGYGLMQLTSSNLVAAADALGGRLDPVANALVGTKYLHDLIAQLGSLKLGLSAYNSGPGGGERYGRVDVPSYVSSVMRFYEEFLRMMGRGVGTARAQGGGMNASMASWVGERGKELWIPDRSGTVISNKNIDALIRMAQNGAQPASQPSITYAPQIDARSNSDSPAVVAALMDARMRAQMAGIRR